MILRLARNDVLNEVRAESFGKKRAQHIFGGVNIFAQYARRSNPIASEK